MRSFALVLFCLALLFSGCASMASEQGPTGVDTVEHDATPPVEKTGAATPKPDSRHFDDGGPITEAPLEPSEMRIQRAGVIKLTCKGKEIRASREIRRAAGKFDALILGFKDTEVNLKLPSNKLDAFIDFLDSQETLEIDEYDFSAFDRTMEHYSLEERLERAQLVHDQLKELVKKSPSLTELERVEKRLDESQKALDALKTTKLDIALHAGRVDIKIMIR